MATPNYSEEEIQFRKRARRRLVGAVVLVALVVAGVPLILPESKPQQDTQQIDIRIPAQDASGYAPKITPAPAPATAPAGDSTASPTATTAAKPSESAPLPIIGAPQPANPSSGTQAVPAKAGVETPAVAQDPSPAKPAAAPEVLVKARPEQKALTYYVQYGAFSEQKNAKQRQSELKAKGVPTFTEVVKTSGGDKIRVRSGPYSAREAAEKVREKAKPLDSKLVIMGQ